ncbi:hypothetical protein SAMN05216474_1476 [Lishizhenia tianjinensis]|uniref:Uncharacterized protein n=1 Tax=Lishizhenia tianjinensis TaxID=477690 RepID=A0A1I6ZMC9_9FLAO|nr:hypothetical protein [Lishizhenia tianjinensis]SFT63802.1 hypothetical protein SAMN05216474_1476 [Lishizhenia tianjinensis]
MLKTLLLTSVVVLFSSFQGKDVPDLAVQNQVYICKSTSAQRYHLKKSCRGLNACTHDIIAVSLATAKGTYQRSLCKWED